MGNVEEPFRGTHSLNAKILMKDIYIEEEGSAVYQGTMIHDLIDKHNRLTKTVEWIVAMLAID